MKYASIFFIFILFSSLSELQADEVKASFYGSVFKDFTETKSITIKDPISEEPTNTELIALYKDKKLLGFVREITTTTGCNSACLPLIYTTFYDAEGAFLKLKSKDGLTKKNHAPMTTEDYSKLEMIVLLAPKELDKVDHPKEMTDAISGETLKEYKDIVVPEAAYSTLRVHLYNQQTMKEIKRLKATQKIP